MKPNEEAMLKSLVAIAWADGRFADEESDILASMIDKLKIGAEGAAFIREYAKTPRTLDDVPVADLSDDDRNTLFGYSVLLSHIDDSQDEAETSMLYAIAKKLGIADEDAQARIAKAEEAAKDIFGF